MHATFCLRLPSIQLGLLHIAEKAGLECRLRTQHTLFKYSSTSWPMIWGCFVYMDRRGPRCACRPAHGARTIASPLDNVLFTGIGRLKQRLRAGSCRPCRSFSDDLPKLVGCWLEGSFNSSSTCFNRCLICTIPEWGLRIHFPLFRFLDHLNS